MHGSNLAGQASQIQQQDYDLARAQANCAMAGAINGATLIGRAPSTEIAGQMDHLENAIQQAVGAAGALSSHLGEAGLLRPPMPTTAGDAKQVREAMQTPMGERLQQLAERVETLTRDLHNTRIALGV